MTRNHAVRPWRSLNWPNRISLLRLLLVAPFILLLMDQQDWPAARHVALGIFAVMAVSDFLDGLLARRLKARTRLGAILDPLADKALIVCAAVLLSLEGTCVPGVRLPNWVVVAIVGKDLWVILGFVVLYLVTDRFRVRPTLAGKACTAAQLAMVLGVLLAPDLNRLGGSAGSHLVAALTYVVTGLCGLAVISYTRLGLVFVAADQVPLENHGPEKQWPPLENRRS
jgi:cardiolipin synthase (CMP-forming)